MRNTIIRSTIVIESGISLVRGVKASLDCLCALPAALANQARLALARSYQGPNAMVAGMSGHPAAFSGMHSTRERNVSAGWMMPWFGMTPVAVMLPKVVAKPVTPSDRVS